ncbi:transcriptional regulator, MarR family [Denitrovibrio acetiphilus DSM 12809]|uniref:Transcriptional regulator, MarR family n=1 Tax=Denitrovibrio acetiphilus (strain DSM 12809 / NBRC 114555 / N2460) TaxID=522772 RepID=D4H5D5_DENA2|nr:MarR family transcriptional regulator [Denitrovibrio acetiphilus]ADD67555.1 transcriptional regulator, MarR family [Denitrovibrio acetiphilus DSM 12809]
MSKKQYDHVDTILRQWQEILPETDTSPMAVFTRILRINKLIQHEITQVFQKHGLHDGDFDLMATLYRNDKPEGLTPNELRNSIVLSSGAMTNRLDRLEAAGRIYRVANPQDRRSILIRLTDEGRKSLDDALGEYLEVLRLLEKPLDDETRLSLTKSLRILLINMENN